MNAYKVRKIHYYNEVHFIILLWQCAENNAIDIAQAVNTVVFCVFFFLLADFMGISACSCSPSFAKFSRNMCMAMKSASLANENEEVPLFAWPIV